MSLKSLILMAGIAALVAPAGAKPPTAGEVEKILKRWSPEARELARDMIATHGLPEDFTGGAFVWRVESKQDIRRAQRAAIAAERREVAAEHAADTEIAEGGAE